jgi:hypothetical protein
MDKNSVWRWTVVTYLVYTNTKLEVELSVSEKYVLSIVEDAKHHAELGYVYDTSILTQLLTSKAIKQLVEVGLVEYRHDKS